MDDLELLDLVYRAATRGDGLQDCLEAMADELVASSASVRIRARGAEIERVSVARGAAPQPRLGGPVETGPAAVTAPGPTVLGSRFGHGDAIELELHCARPVTAAAFSSGEHERFHLIGEHLARAMHLHHRLHRLDGARRMALAGLEMLDHGLALVDATCRLQHANQLARDVFASLDGLVVHEGRVRCADPRADRALAAAVAAACATATPAGPLRVERISDAAPYGLRVTALDGDFFADPDSSPSAPFAALAIVDPARRIDIPPETLCALFDFSPAQARVVSALVAGDAVEDIARAFGVQANTVRAHLKAAYRASGTASQAGLVARVMEAAPWLAARGSPTATPAAP